MVHIRIWPLNRLGAAKQSRSFSGAEVDVIEQWVKHASKRQKKDRQRQQQGACTMLNSTDSVSYSDDNANAQGGFPR